MSRAALLAEFPSGTGDISAANLRDLVNATWLFTGAWSSVTAYAANDVVLAGGSVYLCILANTNQLPPNATYWEAVGGSTAGLLEAANNLSDLASESTARTNLGLGTAATTNSAAYDAAGAAATAQANAEANAATLYLSLAGGTMGGNVAMGGGSISGGGTATFNSFVGSLTGSASGTAANVTGTVAIANGGTGANSAAVALTNLGALALAGGTMTGNLSLGSHTITGVNAISDNQGTPKQRFSAGGSAGTGDTKVNDSTGTTQIDVSSGLVTISNALAVTTVISADGYTTPSFVANTTIFVDPTNGDDSNNGGILTPLLSPSAAAAIAVSGNLILLAPGTYAENVQIVLPNGVSMKGSGVGVTILQPPNTGAWAAGMSALVVWGNGSDVSDLTIDLTQSQTTNRPACIGCNDSAAGNKQFGLNPTLHRVKCLNTGTCLVYSAASTSGSSYLYIEDCVWISNNRCVQLIMSPGTLTVDEFRCQHYFTYSAGVANSNIGECAFAQGKPSRFFNCIFSMADTVNTLWSAVAYQAIDADSPAEFYGCHWITNFPNLPPLPLTSAAGTDPGYWAMSNTSLCKLGAGNTISPQVSDIGQSLYQTLPSPVSHSYPLSLAVSSSSVIPWGESGNALFEAAADAGTLGSNTLTIANVAVGANAGGISVALADGQKMRLRIKNTNASSTAMTLAFGTTYDTSAFTVGTIAAGKKAYMDFTYDSDNSKWDLTGLVNGV